MAWNGVSGDEFACAQAVVTWISTARAAGYGGPDWLPTEADIHKSALFERLRSGKDPLPFPPPIGLACPWYAVVEDPNPHHVGALNGMMGPWFGGDARWGDLIPDGYVSVLQNTYKIVSRAGEEDYIVRDCHCGLTPYRWRLWLDREWRHPTRPGNGGWFLQRVSDGESEE